MVIFSPNALSVVKGVLMARIYHTSCSVKGSELSPESLFDQEIRDADTASLDVLIRDYLRLYQINLSWLKEKSAARLYGRLNYALRHSSPRKYEIIHKALEDAFQDGLNYCLCNVSDNCRKFTGLSRTVFHEVHRMLGFIRFVQFDENTLVAEPKLFHDTADLILKKFGPRYPHFRVVLVLENTALCLENRKISYLDPQPYRDFLQHQDIYAGLWEEYYKSQYLESRKNIPLAQKAIPQKYWDWLTEGKILTKEKKKK